jgi:methylglutaconyl-CoA hydratase
MKETKLLIDNVAGQKISPQLIAQTSQAIAAIRVSKEGQEGLGAFLEKRKPRYADQVEV